MANPLKYLLDAITDRRSQAAVQGVVFDAIRRTAPAYRGSLSADTPLGNGGVGLDSIGFLELVLDVEKRSGVRLRDEHLTAETLATAGRLARHLHLMRSSGHE